uniref:C2H2-type domain-containing protein n=1 Tax=Strongyloides stercoralis TaxID=6248 RepID=A0A0K0E0G9_STRER
MADDGEVTKMDLVCDESPDDKPITITENGKSNNENDLENGINSDNAENINGQLEPPVKKFKSDISTGENNISPVPDDPKNEKDLQSHVSSNGFSINNDKTGVKTENEVINLDNNAGKNYSDESSEDIPKITKEVTKNEITEKNEPYDFESLLDGIEKTFIEESKKPTASRCKILDTILFGIHNEVRSHQEEVKKMIHGKKITLPNCIYVPPSLTVDMVFEHDPEVSFDAFFAKTFETKKPQLTEDEKKKKAVFKSIFKSPNMSQLIMDIGDGLVKEHVYGDIVFQRNLPEPPRSPEEYERVVIQLRPLYEQVKEDNKPYKVKYKKCKACGFKTESQIILAEHLQKLHFDGKRYRCTYCSEVDASEKKILKHIRNVHEKEPVIEPVPDKYQCPICEENFPFKGPREAHYKICKKDRMKVFNIQRIDEDKDINAINKLFDSQLKYYNPLQEAQLRAEAERVKLEKEKQQQMQMLEKAKKEAAAKAAKRTASNEVKNTSQNFNAAAMANLMRSNPQLAHMAALSELLSKMNPSDALKLMQQQAHAVASTNKGNDQNILQQQAQFIQQLILMQTTKQISPQQQLGMIQMAQLVQLLKNQQQQTQLQQLAQQQASSSTASASTSKTQSNNSTDTQRIWLAMMEKAVSTKVIPPELRKHIDIIRKDKNTMNDVIQKIMKLDENIKKNSNYKLSQEDKFVQHMYIILKIISDEEEAAKKKILCELCNQSQSNKSSLFLHLRSEHKQLLYKEPSYMDNGPSIPCEKCNVKFFTWLALERHYFDKHNLVTVDLLHKAQRNEDGGVCKLCKNTFKSGFVTHMVREHKQEVASIAINPSCDFCSVKTNSYAELILHISEKHKR